MDVKQADVFDGVLESLVNGTGGVFAAPSGFDLDAAEAAAGRRGITVLRPSAEDDVRGFVMGALYATAESAAQDDNLHVPVAVGASDRVVRWMVRHVEDTLAQSEPTAPILLLPSARSALDEVTLRWLQATRRSGPAVACFLPATTGDDQPISATTLPQLRENQSLVATLLAVSDVALTASDVLTLSGLDLYEVERAVADLRQAQLAVVMGDHAALATSRIRDAILAKLSTSLQNGLRREVLSTLRRRPNPTIPLADLALISASRNDRGATELLVEAMMATASIDPEAACDYGLAAVDRIDGDGDLLTATAWRLLPLLWQTARADEASALAKRVFTEQGRAEAEAQMLLWLSRLEGSPDQAARLSASALVLNDVSPSIRARLMSVQLRCLTVLGRTADVDRLMPDALALAVSTQDAEALSRVRTCDSIRHFHQGAYERSLQLGVQGEQDWDRSRRPQDERVPEMMWHPHLLAMLGNPAEGIRLLDDRREKLAAGLDAFAVPLLHAVRGQLLLAQGRLDEASDEVVNATTARSRLMTHSQGTDDRLATIATAVRLKVALHRGDHHEVVELQRELQSSHPRPESEAALRIAWWQFLLSDAAAAVTGTPSTDPRSLPPASWLDPTDEILILRALLTRGLRGPAELIRQGAKDRASTHRAHPLATALHAHIDGLVHWNAESLSQAVKGWSALERPLQAAAAESDYGAKLLESRDPHGMTLMMAAHDKLEQMGAHGDAWRIRWALRSHGQVVAGREGSRFRLTPAEHKVVEMALRGLTVTRIAQDQSLSPHTVSTHLRHVYTKLGISSRAELLAWARSV